ncbi:MAG: hypothetical protein HY708_01880 [Ignavibacteriae bacterium]|nr:hypothetical protein [Ignavibacteriota bacterium]
MLDPFLVEQRYQSLLQSLNALCAPRTQLLRILEFLEVLLETGSDSYIDRYASDLLSRLSALMSQLTLTEANIAVLDRLEPVVDKLADKCLALTGTETFSRIIDYLSHADQSTPPWIATRSSD